MKSHYAIVCAVLMCLFCNSAFGGTIGAVSGTVNGWQYWITPSVGPNYFGSPSLGTWQGNALTSLKANDGSQGNSLFPSYYSVAGGTVPDTSIIATPYKSWLGVADPTGNFAGEDGNEIYFGLHVIAPSGTTFSITQLSVTVTSTDGLVPLNPLGCSPPGTGYFGGACFTAGTLTSYNSYTQGWIGSTEYTSGTTPVSELAYEGVGMAINGAGYTGTDAQQMAAVTSDAWGALGNDVIQVCYSISGTNFNACATEDTATPEPATGGLLSLGLACAWVFGKRLRRRARS